MSSRTEKLSYIANIISLVLAFLFTIFSIVSNTIDTYRADGWLAAIGICFISTIFGIIPVVILFLAIRYIHYTLAIILALGLLVGIGYGLYRLFAYTGGGVVSWFEWLSGHF